MYKYIYIYIYIHIQGLQVYASCWPLQEDETQVVNLRVIEWLNLLKKSESLLLKITLHVAGGL